MNSGSDNYIFTFMIKLQIEDKLYKHRVVKKRGHSDFNWYFLKGSF